MADEPTIPEVVTPTVVEHVPPPEPPVVEPVEPSESEVRMTKMEEAMAGITTQLSTLTTALSAPPAAPTDDEAVTEESIRAQFYEDPVKAMDNHSKLRLQPFMDNYTNREQVRTTQEIARAEQSINTLPRSGELLLQIKESMSKLSPEHQGNPEIWKNAYYMRLGETVSADADKGGVTTLPTSEVQPAAGVGPSPNELKIAQKLGISAEAYTKGKGLPSSEKVLGNLLTGVM